MLRTLLFALLAAPCTAFQAPALSVRSALAASRVVTPAMGPFDFLAFGQAGARHILLSDRGKANFLKQQIEEGKMSFAAAAQEYSTCPSASKGGDVSAASSAPCSLMACLQAFPHQRCASAWCVCMCVCVCVCVRVCGVCACTRTWAQQLGTFKPGQMVGPFNDYCFDPDTKLNELEIVRTSFGIHIIELTKKP